MTTTRKDSHSTEFGLWLRNQKQEISICPHCGQETRKDAGKWRDPDPLDSGLGFVTTNIDYVWRNYKTGDWMLLEEKRFMSDVRRWQKELFVLVDKGCRLLMKHYKGFHLLVFEKTNPEDGKIFLDRKEVTKEDLIKFLRFEPL